MKLTRASLVQQIFCFVSSAILGLLELNEPMSLPLSFIGDRWFSAVRPDGRGSGLSGYKCGSQICGNYSDRNEPKTVFVGAEMVDDAPKVTRRSQFDGFGKAGKIRTNLGLDGGGNGGGRSSKVRGRERTFGRSAGNKLLKVPAWRDSLEIVETPASKEEWVFSRADRKKTGKQPSEGDQPTKARVDRQKRPWSYDDREKQTQHLTGAAVQGDIYTESYGPERIGNKADITDGIPVGADIYVRDELYGAYKEQQRSSPTGSVGDKIYESEMAPYGDKMYYVQEGTTRKNKREQQRQTSSGLLTTKGVSVAKYDKPKTMEFRRKDRSIISSRHGIVAGKRIARKGTKKGDRLKNKGGRRLAGLTLARKYEIQGRDEGFHSNPEEEVYSVDLKPGPVFSGTGGRWGTARPLPSDGFIERRENQHRFFGHDEEGVSDEVTLSRLSTIQFSKGGLLKECLEDERNPGACKNGSTVAVADNRRGGSEHSHKNGLFLRLDEPESGLIAAQERGKKHLSYRKATGTHKKTKSALPLRSTWSANKRNAKQSLFHKLKKGKMGPALKKGKVIAVKRDRSKAAGMNSNNGRKLGARADLPYPAPVVLRIPIGEDQDDSDGSEDAGTWPHTRKWSRRRNSRKRTRREGRRDWFRRMFNFYFGKKQAGRSATDSESRQTRMSGRSEEVVSGANSRSIEELGYAVRGARAEDGMPRDLFSATEPTGHTASRRLLWGWGEKPYHKSHGHHGSGSRHGRSQHDWYTNESEDFFGHGRIGYSNQPHLDLNWNAFSGHHLDQQTPHWGHHGHHRMLQDGGRRGRDEKILGGSENVKRGGIDSKVHEKRRQAGTCGRLIKGEGCEGSSGVGGSIVGGLASLKKIQRDDEVGIESRRVVQQEAAVDEVASENRGRLIKENILRTTEKNEGILRNGAGSINSNAGNSAARIGRSDTARGTRTRPLLGGRLSTLGTVSDRHPIHRGEHSEDSHAKMGFMIEDDNEMDENSHGRGGRSGTGLARLRSAAEMQDEEERIQSAWDAPPLTLEYVPVPDAREAKLEPAISAGAAPVYSVAAPPFMDLSV